MKKKSTLADNRYAYFPGEREGLSLVLAGDLVRGSLAKAGLALARDWLVLTVDNMAVC